MPTMHGYQIRKPDWLNNFYLGWLYTWASFHFGAYMIGFPLFYAAIVLIVTLFTGNLLGALTASVIVFVGSFFAMAIPDKHLATDTQEAQRSTFLKMVVMTVILGLTCYFVKGLFVLFMLAFYMTLVHRTNKLNWRVVFGKGE